MPRGSPGSLGKIGGKVHHIHVYQKYYGRRVVVLPVKTHLTIALLYFRCTRWVRSAKNLDIQICKYKCRGVSWKVWIPGSEGAVPLRVPTKYHPMSGSRPITFISLSDCETKRICQTTKVEQQWWTSSSRSLLALNVPVPELCKPLTEVSTPSIMWVTFISFEFLRSNPTTRQAIILEAPTIAAQLCHRGG